MLALNWRIAARHIAMPATKCLFIFILSSFLLKKYFLILFGLFCQDHQVILDKVRIVVSAVSVFIRTCLVRTSQPA